MPESKYDEKQDTDLEALRSELKRKVPWAVFAWAIALIVSIFGVGLTVSTLAASRAVEKADISTMRAGTLETRVEGIDQRGRAEFNEIIRRLESIEKKL